MTNFKKHPDGYKSFLGHDGTGLYSVRVKWNTYAANANGSVLYQVKDGVKIPLNVDQFKTNDPKIFAAVMQEISFQRRNQLAKKLQESNIPSYDRKAYNHKRGFTGSR